MKTAISARLSLLFIPLLVLAGSLPSQAASPESNSPTADSSMAYLKTLADPVRFAGRKSGLPGGDSSQAWIARQFKRWGLQPLLDEGLLVPYDQLVTREQKARMVVKDDPRYGDIELLLGEDFTACTNSGTATLTAPLTLVGYGISKPKKGWDDYGGVNVKGRIVVIKRGRPNSTQDWDEEFSRSYLYPEAVRRGAVAVLFYSGAWPVNGAAISEKAYDPEVPAAYVGDALMRLLFTFTGTTWDEYQRELKLAPKPMPIDRELTLDFNIERVEPGRGYNVAGIVPGTNRELASEAVVIGGHGDHVGPNAEGVIYVGADDNGSGAATVMELARFYATHPQKRTLVFCVFGGEEQGLLGSRALAPRLPDRFHYVTMLNLDMVGRGSGVTGFGGGDQLPEVWDSWFATLPDSLRSHFSMGRAWGGEASDHAPFRNEGIPAFTIWSRGPHDYYHRPDDRFKTIQKPAMSGTLVATSTWINRVANYEEPLADRHLAQRVVWHQGTPLAHTRATATPENDIAEMWANLSAGYMGSVLLFPTPDPENREAFGERLEAFSETLSQNPDIQRVKNLREMRGQARSAHGGVFYALEADNLSAQDVDLLVEWSDAGLSWLILREPEAWLEDGQLTPDAKALIEAVNAEGLIVEFPLASAENIFPMLDLLQSNAVLRGSLSSFRDLKSKEVVRVESTGAGIIIEAPSTVLKRLAKMSKELDEAKVHLQPTETSYGSALDWIGQLQQLGVENKEIVRWIGGNMGRW